MLKRSFWCKSNKKFGELAENKEKKSNFASRIKRTLADYEKIIGILYIRISHRFRGWRSTEGEGSGTDVGYSAYRTKAIQQRTGPTFDSTQGSRQTTDTAADGHHEASRPERADAVLAAAG